MAIVTGTESSSPFGQEIPAHKCKIESELLDFVKIRVDRSLDQLLR